MEPTTIAVKGAREHNLRNVSLELPRNQLICFTGVSGSGKSSFAFDTLYAEGQRRYVESLSSYARQFLGQLPKPDVDQISGLSPSISIQQRTSGWNPRSTVGTVTQIHDYLRVLFARVGTQHCPQCSGRISAQTREQIAGRILSLPPNSQLLILAPVVRGQKGEYRDLFEDMLKQGYARARVDGRIVQLSDDPRLDRNTRHNIEIVVDRLVLKDSVRGRLAEAVENALSLGQGTLIVQIAADKGAGKDLLLSANYACAKCGLSFEPPSPQLFSFNSPTGMCLSCDGMGTKFDFDPELLVPSPRKSFLKLAIAPMRTRIGKWRRHIYRAVAEHIGFALSTPWKDLPPKARKALLYGTGDTHLTFEWRWSGGVWRHGGAFGGVIKELQDKYRRSRSSFVRAYYEKYMRRTVCPDCGGARLNRQALAVRIGGKNIQDVCAMDIAGAFQFFSTLRLTDTEQTIAEEVLKEIRGRLEFLKNVGLHYLALERTAPTLSGGESQRIRLAGQIGAGLVGVLYILDEPSVGLHARDNRKLLDSLLHLRDMGNTVVIVEHDEETMRSADTIVDFGPGPGVRGGEVIATGDISKIARTTDSLTGQYLVGKKRIEVPGSRRPVDKNTPRLTVRGARHNNLKDIDVSIPLERVVCVTGVSGSGKSSLVNDIIREQLSHDLNDAEKYTPGLHRCIEGKEHLDKVITIDQKPIGRTPRSNPATYVKVFDEIRRLYARLPDSRVRGYLPGRFSFNVPGGTRGGGRCEACEGNGANKMEMDFLADIWVTCPVCRGRRFNRETLQIYYKKKNIADVLEMDVQQALQHFANVPKIAGMLQTLHDVGLDYIKLGQSSTTLSGGEAQRIKLARELVKRSTGRTLYLLDEPTTGLHFDDIRRLLKVLDGFAERGNTVVVIEHNLDVIKTADWVIDLGPEGGAEGGYIVVEGTPEQVAENKKSYTGKVLKKVLNPRATRTKVSSTGKPRPKRNGRTARMRSIRVVGAAEHNLKNVTVDIPREKTTVCCGLSGSGKSSLALDTVYTEGQRRYVESLSAYARQFLGQLQKPKVEHIFGLSPAISIEQKAAIRSPRSTVGTITEVYDYMRVLWARVGTPYCPPCRVPIGSQSSDEIADKIMCLPEGTRVMLLAPIDRTGQETYEELFAREKANGFARVRIDGEVRSLHEPIEIDHRRRHQVELVVDRVVIKHKQASRIFDSIEQALSVGNGVMIVNVLEAEKPAKIMSRRLARNGDLRFSQHYACDNCGTSYEELTSHHFSFNSRMGWCDSCEGLGTQRGASPSAIAVHPTRSIRDGAIAGWDELRPGTMLYEMVRALAEHVGFDLKTPWNELNPEHQLAILQGCGQTWIDAGKVSEGLRFRWRGFFPSIDRATRSSWQYRHRLRDLVTDVPCEKCGGSRLRPDAAAVRVGDKTIREVTSLPLNEALQFFAKLKLDARQRKVTGELLHEITSRLQFLVDVGLDYVSLNRSAATLSGGESQRIRLASQVGSGLTGVLYVLDEPTIGLHPRDNHRLINALGKLRDLGNTLLIVEHDREVIDHADHVLDFGPGAGAAGGQIVAATTPQKIRTRRASLTGKFLAGKEAIFVPTNRRPIRPGRSTPQTGETVPEKWLTVYGARQNNLKEIDVSLPLGRFTVVTGVSGSGKSSLVSDILFPALANRLHRARHEVGGHEEIEGIEYIDKVINVDQSPIGNSPTSNPATFTGVFDLIRELYARLPESKIRGYSANRFSFNRPGGRCEACWGNGQRCIEMHFLPDVWVECENCKGTRYTAETLQVRYKNKSIADVLNMRVSEALEHFKSIPKIRRMLQTLEDVGLGYVSLGQPAPTLSGGEAQRVKLAAELGRPSTGKTLYILDEPTTGLHFADLRKLLAVLNRLVDMHNTVICIEHNLDVVKTADWVIDLGPEAGLQGGQVVAAGTPEQVAACKRSHTGRVLKGVLADGPRRSRQVFDPQEHAEAEAQLDRVASVGDESSSARMPWQKEGHKWHTEDPVDSQSRKVKWDPRVLEFIVDECEKVSGFERTNWNHRTRIEIKAPNSKTLWFCHILTGGQWLLEVTFRVPPKTFSAAALQRELKIVQLDERPDLPIYGQWDRLSIRTGKRTHDDVRIFLHDMKDVKRPAFRRFIKRAAAAYHQHLASLSADRSRAEPWKTDGKAWHLSQKSVPTDAVKRWSSANLLDIIGRLRKVTADLAIDWTGKAGIKFKPIKAAGLQGRVKTNKSWGLPIELRTPPGTFTPTMVDRLGKDLEIVRRPDYDLVRFWVRRGNELDMRQLASVADRLRAE